MSPRYLDADADRAGLEAKQIHARRAETRGRRVKATADDYEAFARRRGREGVAEALIARANVRWENIHGHYGFAAAIVLPYLSRVVVVDRVLAAFGLSYDPDQGPTAISPSSTGEDWLGHLRWGADSMAAAARLLLLGQPVGAAALLRQQTERWTENRASALGIARLQAESKSEYYERAWSGAWQRQLSVGGVYAMSSELLHGRGPMTPMARWEALDLAAWPTPPDAFPPLQILAELATLTFQQLTACCLDLARRAGRADLERTLLGWPQSVSPFDQSLVDQVWRGLVPLTPPALTHEWADSLTVADRVYVRSLRQPINDDVSKSSLTALAFLSRRSRAVQTAVWALNEEQKMLGQDFNLEGLHARELKYLLIGEVAALAARWIGGSHGDALAIGSSALRSSFLLWLEDDSRAMITVRSALESSARAKTWRMKPARAGRLEQRAPRTSPSDWLAAAGWGRLGLMNAALGELSHMTPDSRWFGALDALGALQPDAIGPIESIHTARREALDRVAYLLAVEATASIEPLAPTLSSVVRELTGVPRDPEPDLERWLNEAGRHARFDFGPSSFRPINDEEAARIELQIRMLDRP